MEELWLRFIGLLRQHAPEVQSWLNPGATDAQLREAEEALGIRFPDDIAAFYRVYNGQNPEAPYFWQGREILSLERIRDEWCVWKGLLDGGEFEGIEGKPIGPVKTNWWNPKWIPITYNGAGDHHCLDLDPAQGGDGGQIIEFWHDYEPRTRVAPNFTTWFELFVNGCATGQFVWSEDEESFVLADNA